VRRVSTRVRWAVPAGAVAAVGVVVAATAMASASVPSLPHRTAAQLIAEVSQAASKPLGPFTATVQESANLGLPQLPQAVQPSGAAGITSGTQTATIWYADPQHFRIANPVQAGESDLRLNGRTLWLWNSKTQTATKVTLPAHVTGLPAQAGNGAAAGTCPPPTANTACATFTPMAAASQVLKALGPSTVVAVESNVQAPTGPAYQLALEPRTSQSLIGKVVIAIDASTHLPVSVDVFGRGSTGVVYSLGLTALSFGAPAASNFTFTPPPGATVKTQVVPGTLKGALPPGLNLGGLPSVKLHSVAAAHAPVSLGMPSQLKPGQMPVVPISKQGLAAINAKFAASLPASMSKAQRAAMIKQFDRPFKVVSGASNVGIGQLGSNGGGFFSTSPITPAGPKVKVIGKDWLSVVATPADPSVAAAVQGLLNANGPAASPSTPGLFGSSYSGSSASSSSVTFQAVGPNLGALRALLLASTPVHGSWGSGRLLQTSVLSVLITGKGQILVGAVTPAVLYADVPSAG
jgi:outer membrane lipoprotein-sorting protein